MPQLANLLIYKADPAFTTTYTGVAPSAGADSPAVWRDNSRGTALNHRPELRLTAKPGSNGKSDRMRATFVYPMIATNSATGLTSVVDKASGSVDWIIPQGMNQVDVVEFAHQFVNLLGSGVFRACVEERFSAT